MLARMDDVAQRPEISAQLALVFGRSGRDAEARRLLDGRRSWPPGVLHSWTAVSALLQVGLIDQARTIAQRAAQDRRFASERAGILFALADRGEIAAAIEMLPSVADSATKVMAAALLGRAMIEAGQRDEARELLLQSLPAARRLSGYEGASAVGAMAEALVVAGEKRLALDLLRQGPQPAQFGFNLRRVLFALAQVGAFPEAEHYVREQLDGRDALRALHDLMNEAWRLNARDEAIRLAREAADLALGLSSLSGRAEFLSRQTTIAASWRRHEEVDRLTQMTEEVLADVIISSYSRASALLNLGRAASTRSQRHEAIRMLSAAEEAVRQVNERDRRAELQVQLAVSLYALGERDRGLGLLLELFEQHGGSVQEWMFPTVKATFEMGEVVRSVFPRLLEAVVAHSDPEARYSLLLSLADELRRINR